MSLACLGFLLVGLGLGILIGHAVGYARATRVGYRRAGYVPTPE